MLLEHLSICNYGVYAGRNHFDLATTPEKPIIVIGGMNGAGKTTLLESMMVVLYGKTWFGPKRSKKEYLHFIYDKMHRSGQKRAKTASIELGFRFYHNGSEDKYVINRSWDVEGATVSELFTVQKNGHVMNDIDESQWQSFLEGLIPLGIANLFFFDGEKIVQIAEDNGKNNDGIKASLDTLIGADLIHRLHADLDLYMVRRSGTGNDLTLQYEKMVKEKDQLICDIESLNDERMKKMSEIEDLNSKIALKESTVSGIGGGYADIRGDLLAKKAALEEKSKIISKQIHEELASNAPMYLVPSLLKRVKAQMKDDNEALVKRTASSVAKIVKEEMRKKLADPKFWPDGANSGQLTNIVLCALDDIGKPVDLKMFFDLSPDDTLLILGIMKDIKDSKKEFLDITSSFAGLVSDLEDTESNLARIPKDDELGPHISELNQMHQEMGLLNGEVAHLDQGIVSKRSYAKILQSRMRTMINTSYQNKSASSGIKLASKMQTVLDAYYSSLKEKKTKELESNLLQTAQLLLHKESIRRIAIDRDTFEIKVYDDEHIPGDFLSKGEKQIVGTALLWAIAMTCGRSLPFVIDTPLGRLDGQHVSNLIEKFYPTASHQMILLSHNREIGPKEYAKLLPYISNSYQIKCDKTKSVTSVIPGYFEEEKIAQT